MAEPQISQQTINQTTIPDYAKPYVQELLGQTQALTDFSQNPYMQYMGERQAQYSPLQQQAFQGMQGMQQAPQIDQATGIAALASNAALNYGGYNPGAFQNAFNAPSAYLPTAFSSPTVQNQDLQQFGMGPAQQINNQQVSAPNLSNLSMQAAQNMRAPRAQAASPDAAQMGQVGNVNAPQLSNLSMQAAQTDFNPNLQANQMGPAQQVSTKSFAQPGSAESYMNPYMQNVVGIQQREAQRQADIASTGRHGEQTKQGAFGGSRAAIMDAEAARNLATQKGDIQAQGSNAAYQQAQQQFNAEQTQGLQAALANQQAGLTVGQQNLGAQQATQQLGTQTAAQMALANLGNQQQTNAQNLSAGLQQQGLQAQTGMQAQQLNQQAGLTTAQQNAQMAQQMGIANLGNQQQANLANQQYQFQTNQANQANQQQANAQNLSAGLQQQALGAGQNLQAQQLNQAANMQSQLDRTCKHSLPISNSRCKRSRPQSSLVSTGQERL